MQRILLLFLSILIFISCNKEENIKQTVNQKSDYLFLGHIYNKTDRIDPRLEKIDYSQYKGIWLGGDLCSETTQKQSTIDYLDDFFDLSNENTHWAVGNHDVRNGNLDWIRSATGRELFYTETKDNITIAVLDTNLGHVKGRGSTCEESDQQALLLNTLLDTIQNSSHLVVLTHWVVWGETASNMRCKESANNCLSTFQFLCADGQSKFPTFIYDKLVAVEQRGIEVIIVSGDGGIFSKQYHFETKEGVDFLISGIYSTLDRNNPPTRVTVNLNPDSVLIFHHEVETQKLFWEFVNLDELAGE